MIQRTDLRNIAIIAHVDHGKTTLVDAMLRQSHIFRDNQVVEDRVMDSNALERERGITILSKNTAVTYRDVKINIVDTPGHADFGGEVERVMHMVDGVLLLVDAVEGPMAQTRFVLRKALQAGHPAIVVVNKVDRPQSRPNHVVNATFDLFVDLGASDEQAEFAVIYASGIKGQCGHAPDNLEPSLEALFATIVERIPPPMVDIDAPGRILATTTAYDDYLGRIVTGRLERGKLLKGQPITHIRSNGTRLPTKVTALFAFNGLQRTDVDEATAGDIIALAGIGDARIGDTIAAGENPEPLPPITVEEPTVRMSFGINTSPFAGREGTYVTSRKLRERLYAETERDVALRVEDTDQPDVFIVSGRGELHLGILIETMRREGYEFQVSNPEVIMHYEDGITKEPVELVEIEVSDEFQGVVIEMLGQRAGQMRDMRTRDDGAIQYVYVVPTRGLLGFRQPFLTATRGQGIMTSLFLGYEPMQGTIQNNEFGALIASESGTATTYAIHAIQERGQLFIEPGEEVYEGMIVGQHIRESDLEVNVCKKKHLTNIRNNVGAETVRLDASRRMSLDDAIQFITENDFVEVTPKGWRLRKKLLSADERSKLRKKRKLEQVGS